jgi:ferric enterobactin receptor
MTGTRLNLKSLVWASAALAAASGNAWAQQAPPPPAPPPQQAEPVEPADEEEIIVMAAPGDDVRIDRRVYTLSEDPAAQTSSMVDILGRVPSVTVAPSGAVRLLGGDATIQVDGQVVPGDSLDAVLRSLSGSDIERIEVITNPSAQFAAQTEGGIINIVTRQRFRLGLTGSVSAGADSLGGYQANASPTWTQDAWSFGVRGGVNQNKWEGDTSRVREDFSSGNVTRDSGRWEGEGGGINGGAFINYRPNDRRRASLNLNAFSFESDTETASTRVDDGGPVYMQTIGSDNAFSNVRLGFDFQQSGAAEGELFKFNANLASFENEGDSDILLEPADGSGVSRYRTPRSNASLNSNAKLDYERPLGENNLLSLGLAVDQTDQEIDTEFVTLMGAPVSPDFESTLRGLQTTTAAYGTYQFGIGRWTLLPGVRVEQYRREVRSTAGQDDDTAVDTFPSFHLRRNLRENLDVDLSYSSRIARPQINQLDPAIRYFESTRGNSGNPDLQPTTTDAFEANLVYQNRDRTYNVTFYDRLSEDIVSQFTEVTPDGVFITRPVNAGESEQRGAQIIMRAPLFLEGWRYAVSANFLQREFDVLQFGQIARRSEFEYSGNAQIEYRDRVQSDVGADHVQLELQFQGPQYFLQGERDEFVVANFTWRRRLTEKVFGVLTVQDVFDSQPNISELRTNDFFERSETQSPGTRIRFALTYQFGAAQAQNQNGPPPDAGANPPMMPTMPGQE